MQQRPHQGRDTDGCLHRGTDQLTGIRTVQQPEQRRRHDTGHRDHHHCDLPPSRHAHPSPPTPDRPSAHSVTRSQPDSKHAHPHHQFRWPSPRRRRTPKTPSTREQIAQEKLPGDPRTTDYGALEAARAPHCAIVLGTTVYPEPHHRAAALLQPLVRLPALEHSNELYAATAAAAFLDASGRPVKVSTDQAVDLVEQTANGLDVRDIATALANWTS